MLNVPLKPMSRSLCWLVLAGARRPAARWLAVGAVLVGCAAPDNRISRQKLQDLEQAAAKIETPTSPPTQYSLNELQPYRIAAGDILSVSLTGLPNPAGASGSAAAAPIRARVQPDGAITLPMVGAVKIAGMDLAGAERAITEAFVPNFVQALSVFIEPSQTEGVTVVVVGAAGTPGLVNLKMNQRNLLYALASCGGFSSTTSGKVTVKPIQSDKTPEVYDLTNVNDLRRALLAPPLQSGDLLEVEARPVSAIYVIGLVRVQGPVAVPPGASLSLVRAIASAGGLRDYLNPKEATLWRRLSDGQQVRVKVDLAGIMAGTQNDLNLFPGDVLDVPHTTETVLAEWALANIRIGPFGVGAFYDPIEVATFKDNNDDNASPGQVFRDSLIFNATNAIAAPR